MTEEQVFLAALELPDATSRAAFLDEQCAGDAGLRGNVDALLASHFKSGDFMDVPAPVQIDVEPPFDHAVTIESDVMPAQRFPEPVSDDVKFLDPTSRPDSLGRIGRYEVLQVLGVGGFGIVLRAFDDVLERIVAVKVMAPQLATTSPARKRFLREARSSAQVRHENVVQVYEVGEQPLPHLVMEFIPGETLQQRLDRIGPLDVHEVLRIGRQIAEGLAAAHAMDLIHRDIKPGNVLLEGGQLKVKITDFGLARAADDASMTQSGQIVGTPMYMAPEQVWGHALDQRADLFSLGTVMYQMVSGRTPFRAESSVAVLKRVAEDTPRNIREIIPETPQWLCDIITKLHAKQPDERYQSARDVADVLADCEEQLKLNSKLQDYSRIPRARPAAGRRRWKWAVAAVLLLSVIALAATELAGVTHLFRDWQTAVAPIKSGSDATPVAAAKQDTPVPVTKQEPPEVKTPPAVAGPFTDADVQRIAALPAAEQLEEVRKELVRLNPGFDGQVEHRIEGDVVVEFRVVTDQVTDISPVRALTGLRSLSCSGSFVGLGQLGASALLPLKGLPLTHLDFRDSPAVTDLSALAEMKLTSLDCRATNVGDADVKHLTGMKDLQWLSLWGTKVTDASLKEVGGFKNLEHLSLQGAAVTDAGLKELAGLDKLEYLDLYAVAEVTDAGLEHLARLKSLKYVELRGPRVTDEGVDKLAAALPGLRISTWSRTIEPKVDMAPFTDADAKRIAALPATEQVEEVRKELIRLNSGFDGTVGHKIEGDVVTEFRIVTDQVTDIAPIRVFNALRVLDLNGTHVKYKGNGQLADLSPLAGMNLAGLTRLNLSFTVVGDAGLVHFKDCKNLTFLGLDSTQVSDAGLAYFKDCTNLTLLYLGRLKVSNAGMAHFKDCKKLTFLDLSETPVGDAGLDNFKGCENLTLLGLGRTGSVRRTLVTDAGLANFKNCNKLQNLNLLGTQLSDVGLAYFKDCKELTRLHIAATKVADLSPLKGMPLKELDCDFQPERDATILRSIKTLEKINTVPASEFWDRYDKGESALAPFTDADVQRIAALPASEQVEQVRKELMRLNPGFGGQLEHKIEGDAVTELHVNTDEIFNIAPVRALLKLVYLDCRGTYPNKGKLSDLSPLKGMKLSRLDCSSTQASDLTPLTELPLTFLAVNHNPVSDLSPIVKMPLESLAIAETKVSDLSPLAGMKIKTLGAQLLPVTDLSPLAGMPLTGLDLYHTIGVTDLEALRGMPLEALNIQDLPVSDLSPLKGMTTLRMLLLQGNKVSDLTPLAGLKLTDLLLLDKQITDLAPLKGLPLIRLHIHGTGASDLTPLKDMPLVEIRLDPQNITQGLDILREMKSLKTIGIDGNQAWPPAEFWERFDQGEFGTSRTSSVHDTWLKEWLQLVPTLTAEQQVAAVVAKLKERNPGLGGTAKHKIKDGVVTELTFTPVTGQDAVTDLSPVRALAGLTSLNLWGCSGLGDLEPLKGLKLTRLLVGSLDVSIQVRDLEPLRGMKLTELQLYRCQVQNLEPLQDMPLTKLTLFSRQVRDLGPLQGLPLTTLGLAYCTQIQDFTPLAGLPLTSLHLNDCRVRNLEPFKGMKLTELHLTGTPVRDLELLKGMPLKKLSIFQKPGVTDLKPLQGMELEEIRLTPKNITQGLEILRDMQSLKTIGIDYSQSWPPAEFWERFDKGEFK